MSRSVAANGAHGSVLKGWVIENIMLLDKEAMKSKTGNMLGRYIHETNISKAYSTIKDSLL